MRDRKGRVRFFHGVNAVWKRKPYFPPSKAFGTRASKSYFDGRDALWLARHGLNSVRLGVLFAGVEPKKDDYDGRYIRRMRRLARVLGKRGVSVVVDFHQDMYNEKFDGEGFPRWMVYDDGVPPSNCRGFPGNYFTPAVRRTFDNLWDDSNGQWDQYRAAWKKVARAFRGERNLLGYDLLNEPWPGSQTESCANTEGCPAFDTQKLQPFFEHVMRGIRDVDGKGIIWWDANVITNSGPKNQVGSMERIKPARNQGVSFHVYCIAGSPSTGIRPGQDPSCPNTEGVAFDNQHAAARRNRSSLFLTEFGASDNAKDINRVTRLADRKMTSWHYWHYGEWRDPTTSGTGGSQGLFRNDLKRPETLKRKKAKLLIRTYPQAVAGTPKSFRFHPGRKDRLFEMTYKADSGIKAPTVIFVPVGLHYHGQYAVKVTGPAKIISGVGERKLRIKNKGSGRVHVRLTRLN